MHPKAMVQNDIQVHPVHRSCRVDEADVFNSLDDVVSHGFVDEFKILWNAEDFVSDMNINSSNKDFIDYSNKK